MFSAPVVVNAGRANIALPFMASSATSLILAFEDARSVRKGTSFINPAVRAVQLTHGSKNWPTNPLNVANISELMANNEIAMNNGHGGAAKWSEMNVGYKNMDGLSFAAAIDGTSAPTADAGKRFHAIILDLSKSDSGRDSENVFVGTEIKNQSTLMIEFAETVSAPTTMHALLISETLITIDEETSQMMTTF